MVLGLGFRVKGWGIRFSGLASRGSELSRALPWLSGGGGG
jgi:hypothetical protein